MLASQTNRTVLQISNW